jgi:hypothetical protein
MFAASAKTVMPIMRIDQTNWSFVSSARRSKNSAGKIRRNSPDAPKTMEPACKVFLMAFMLA